MIHEEHHPEMEKLGIRKFTGFISKKPVNFLLPYILPVLGGKEGGVSFASWPSPPYIL